MQRRPGISDAVGARKGHIRSRYNEKLHRSISSVVIAAGTLLACLAVHEFGHALAAWITGGGVGEFVLFSLRPHVRILGAATQAHEAWRTVAGSACSLAACFALLLLGPARSTGWQTSKDMAAIFAAVELIGWSLSSVTRPHSVSPDDAERFLECSGTNPYLVVAACVLIGFAGILAFRRSEQGRRTYLVESQPCMSAPESTSAPIGEVSHC
jgi:hypothetical protein